LGEADVVEVTEGNSSVVARQEYRVAPGSETFACITLL